MSAVSACLLLPHCCFIVLLFVRAAVNWVMMKVVDLLLFMYREDSGSGSLSGGRESAGKQSVAPASRALAGAAVHWSWRRRAAVDLHEAEWQRVRYRRHAGRLLCVWNHFNRLQLRRQRCRYDAAVVVDVLAIHCIDYIAENLIHRSSSANV